MTENTDFVKEKIKEIKINQTAGSQHAYLANLTTLEPVEPPSLSGHQADLTSRDLVPVPVFPVCKKPAPGQSRLRTRRYRQRQQAGESVATVVMQEAWTEALAALGYLHPWKTDDRAACNAALAAFLRDAIDEKIAASGM
jgi:hypothetical protein